MGAHFSVYAGWCFKVPKVLLKRVEHKHACENASCAQHGIELRGKERQAKFCQECGQPIGQIESSRMVEEHLSLRDVEGEWDDILIDDAGSEGGEKLWVPRGSECGHWMGEQDDNETVVLQDTDIEAAAERFLGSYGDFCEAVEAKYKVQLRPVYAIVPYWD